jgi:hypothetical protein
VQVESSSLVNGLSATPTSVCVDPLSHIGTAITIELVNGELRRVAVSGALWVELQ